MADACAGVRKASSTVSARTPVGLQLPGLAWRRHGQGPADHMNQRKLLIATQATMGGLALALGVLAEFKRAMIVGGAPCRSDVRTCSWSA